MTSPLVSLCCSTYSRPDLFEQSLEGMISQVYEPLEIVVLVDGGNPQSIALLTKCSDKRLRWFATDKPSGMIPAWNKVVRASKGRYFLYCADDDILCADAVERQVAVLESNDNVGFCHGDFFLIDDDGKRVGDWRSHEGTWIKPGLAEWQRYLLQPKCCMQTCVVRRSLWELVGGWDEDAGYPGDNSLYLKLLRISDVGHVAHYACHYRVRTRSPDSWLKNSNKVREDVALARKHLANLPAALAGRRKVLENGVRIHFSLNALTVLGDRRGALADREPFARWVRDELLPVGLTGAMLRAVLFLGLEEGMNVVRSVQVRLRGLARRFVRLLLAVRKQARNVTAR